MARTSKNSVRDKPSLKPRCPSSTREVCPDGTVIFKRRGSNCPGIVRFPQKLWNIIQSCKSGAIGWTVDGENIFINYKLFKKEYLDNQGDRIAINLTPPWSPSPNEDFDNKTCNQSEATSNRSKSYADGSIFKTSQITSFIRQLNLYGFRKVVTITGYDDILQSEYLDEDFTNSFLESRTESKPELQLFNNPQFIRGRHDLIDKIARCTHPMEPRYRSRQMKKIKKMTSAFHNSKRQRIKLETFLRPNPVQTRNPKRGNEGEDCNWLDVQLDELPEIDDDFLEQLLSDTDQSIEEQQLLNQSNDDGPKANKWLVSSRTLDTISKTFAPPDDSIVQPPFNHLTIDRCFNLLDSTANNSGVTKSSRVRNLTVEQILDANVPPTASVMVGTDPFLSATLMPELF